MCPPRCSVEPPLRPASVGVALSRANAVRLNRAMHCVILVGLQPVGLHVVKPTLPISATANDNLHASLSSQYFLE